jgi:hypothetical protein
LCTQRSGSPPDSSDHQEPPWSTSRPISCRLPTLHHPHPMPCRGRFGTRCMPREQNRDPAARHAVVSEADARAPRNGPNFKSRFNHSIFDTLFYPARGWRTLRQRVPHWQVGGMARVFPFCHAVNYVVVCCSGIWGSSRYHTALPVPSLPLEPPFFGAIADCCVIKKHLVVVP